MFLLIVLAASALPAAAEDWTTTDGTNYQNVRVVRVEDDAVTIIYKEGGALVPLFKLPPALQRKFDYDPVKAKLAAEARLKEDAANSKALQEEIAAADAKRRQDEIKYSNQLGQTNSVAH